ncbi:MAG: hypothetical protein R2865_15060 [Deinococcales bacterium]
MKQLSLAKAPEEILELEVTEDIDLAASELDELASDSDDVSE